jgi:hypothetical protein
MHTQRNDGTMEEWNDGKEKRNNGIMEKWVEGDGAEKY